MTRTRRTATASSKGHPIVKVIIRWAITATIFGVVLTRWKIDLSPIVSALREPAWIIAALSIPLLVLPSIRVSRLRFFFRLRGVEERPIVFYKISQLAAFWGLLFPAASGSLAVAAILLERRHPDQRGVPGSVIVLEKGLGMFVLVLLGLLASYLVPDVKGIGAVRGAMVVAGLAVGGLAAIVLSRSAYERASRWLYGRRRLGRAGRYLERLHGALLEFPVSRTLVGGIPLILLYQLATIVNVAVLYRSFGIAIPFRIHLAFMPLIFLATIVPLTIQGLGIREGGFVLLYGLIGVSPPVAVGVSLLNFATLVLVPAAVGGVMFLSGLHEGIGRPPGGQTLEGNGLGVEIGSHPKSKAAPSCAMDEYEKEV